MRALLGRDHPVGRNTNVNKNNINRKFLIEIVNRGKSAVPFTESGRCSAVYIRSMHAAFRVQPSGSSSSTSLRGSGGVKPVWRLGGYTPYSYTHRTRDTCVTETDVTPITVCVCRVSFYFNFFNVSHSQCHKTHELFPYKLGASYKAPPHGEGVCTPVYTTA
jgi:hypothetical protein